MWWAFFPVLVVAFGVLALVSTMRQIGGSRDEVEYYRLSVRFWGGLAALSGMLAMTFAPPMIAMSALHPARTEIGWVTLALVSMPILVVAIAGVVNALALFGVLRRRHITIGRGLVLDARVVQRSRRWLGQDLMMVTVETEVPRPRSERPTSYRQGAEPASVQRRFIELGPADHWERFEPGTSAKIEIDPDAPDQRWAVLLFDLPDGSREVQPSSSVSSACSP